MTTKLVIQDSLKKLWESVKETNSKRIVWAVPNIGSGILEEDSLKKYRFVGGKPESTQPVYYGALTESIGDIFANGFITEILFNDDATSIERIINKFVYETKQKLEKSIVFDNEIIENCSLIVFDNGYKILSGDTLIDFLKENDFWPIENPAVDPVQHHRDVLMDCMQYLCPDATLDDINEAAFNAPILGEFSDIYTRKYVTPLNESTEPDDIVNMIKQLYAQYAGEDIDGHIQNTKVVNLPNIFGHNDSGKKIIEKPVRIVLSVDKSVIDFLQKFSRRIEEKGWYLINTEREPKRYLATLARRSVTDTAGTFYYPVPENRVDEVMEKGISPWGDKPSKTLLGRTPAAARLLAFRAIKNKQGWWENERKVAILSIDAKKSKNTYYPHPDLMNYVYTFKDISSKAVAHKKKEGLSW